MFVSSYPKCTLPIELTATLFRRLLKYHPEGTRLSAPILKRRLRLSRFRSQWRVLPSSSRNTPGGRRGSSPVTWASSVRLAAASAAGMIAMSVATSRWETHHAPRMGGVNSLWVSDRPPLLRLRALAAAGDRPDPRYAVRRSPPGSHRVPPVRGWPSQSDSHPDARRSRAPSGPHHRAGSPL